MSEGTGVSIRRRRSRSEIEQLVKAYGQSSLTRQAFCAQHSLSVGTLDRYRKRCRRMEGPQPELSRIVPVELVSRHSPTMSTAALGGGALYLELAKGRRIAVSCGFDATTLLRLVTTLEEA
jgi:hypothetical protein